MAYINSPTNLESLEIGEISKAARVTLFDGSGRQISHQSKNSFIASTLTNASPAVGFTPAAAATDIAIISGSASKTIRILSVQMFGTATAATNIDLLLIKRSGPNSGGTFVACPFLTSLNTANGASSTVATCGHYTVNPTSLGASDGVVARKKIMLPIATTPIPSADNYLWHPLHSSAQLADTIVLNGVNEFLAVNNNAAAIPAGSSQWYVIYQWTEE